MKSAGGMRYKSKRSRLELGGIMQTIKVAHFRMAYSRQMFVAAYPRETQEMVRNGLPERREI
ncbi:MAG: hypothetical protein WJ306_05690 [Ferrovum myxofaciens]